MRGRQKIILVSVDSKLTECHQWLDVIKRTRVDQPVVCDSDDRERQLSEIQVSTSTALVRFHL